MHFSFMYDGKIILIDYLVLFPLYLQMRLYFPLCPEFGSGKTPCINRQHRMKFNKQRDHKAVSNTKEINEGDFGYIPNAEVRTLSDDNK